MILIDGIKMEPVTLMPIHINELARKIINVMGNRIYNHYEDGFYSHMSIPKERKCNLKIQVDDNAWYGLYSAEVLEGHLVLGVKSIEHIIYYYSPTLYGKIDGFGHINQLHSDDIISCSSL